MYSNKLIKKPAKMVKVDFNYVGVEVTFKKNTEISFSGDYDNKNKFRISIKNGEARTSVVSSMEQLKTLSRALAEYISMAEAAKRINDNQGFY